MLAHSIYATKGMPGQIFVDNYYWLAALQSWSLKKRPANSGMPITLMYLGVDGRNERDGFLAGR